jgi:hypothetical protein
MCSEEGGKIDEFYLRHLLLQWKAGHGGNRRRHDAGGGYLQV